jgi:hypothetical protein
LPVLIATPIPNATAALRVPPVNVAPSFSNEQVTNDLKGGRNPSPRVAPETAAAHQENASFAQTQGASPGPFVGSQATFLAQLISQDVSPQAIIYLAQYEKLISYGNVKYKPSNAGKPQPAGLFAQLVHSDAPQPEIRPETVRRAPVAAVNSDFDSNEQETAIAAPTDYYEEPVPAVETATEAPRPQTPILVNVRFIDAYLATSARNEEFVSDNSALA